MTPILEAKELTQKFGGLTAVDNVSLHVGVDELVALIGPNGAGKTTLFNMLTGVNTPTEETFILPERKLPAKGLCRGSNGNFQNVSKYSSVL